MAYDWDTLGIAVATNVVVCFLVLLIFDWLRCKESLLRFYAPRYYVKTPGYRRPKLLPNRKQFFGWARSLFGYTETEILAVAGYDGLVYLRIFRFGMQLFGVLSFVLLATVLPVNWTDDLVDENQLNRERSSDKDKEVESTDYDKVTMANVHDESNRLWMHLIAAWFVTFYTLYLLWKYNKSAVDLRIEYLASTKKGGQSQAVFVTDIPGIRFGHPLDRLMQSFVFKFLPASVKQRIQDSVETMTNAAAGGIGAIGALGTSAYGKGKAMLTDDTSHKALLELPEDDSLSTFVRPVAKEITDMEPAKWMQERLTQGLSHEQAVELMYREVFPEGEVCCANMVMNTSALEPLIAKLNKAVQSLEDILDQYAISIRNNEEIKKFTTRVIPMAEGKWAVAKYGNKPIKVDLMEHLVLKIQNLKSTIDEEDGKAKSQVTASAFVVFSSRWSQVVGASAFFHHFESTWNAESAPNPHEIVWENLKWRTWERAARRVTVWFLFFLLCCFFMIPVAAVQAIIEVDRLEDVAVLGSIVEFPLVSSILQAVLPGLVLNIFLAVLPMILHIMNHYQGYISRSAIDTEVTRKYFIFLIITVFLASFFVRSFLQQLDLLIEDPSAVVDALGSSAPQSSTFFLYLMMTDVFFGGAFQMLEIPGLVLTWIFTMLSGTQRAKDRIWQSKPLLFGHIVSRHTLNMFLGIVFSVINPLILPVAFVYFLLMNLFNRYKLLYMLSESYQSGGLVWNQVYEHVIVGLIFHHLMMLGILGLKKFPYAALIFPLPVLTIFFKLYMDGLFKRPLTLLSLRAARDLDTMDHTFEKQHSSAEKDLSEINDSYKNDCFKVDWDQIQATLAEVPRVQSALEKPHEEAIPMVAKLNIRDAAEFYPIESHVSTTGEVENPEAKPSTSETELLNN